MLSHGTNLAHATDGEGASGLISMLVALFISGTMSMGPSNQNNRRPSNLLTWVIFYKIGQAITRLHQSVALAKQIQYF